MSFLLFSFKFAQLIIRYLTGILIVSPFQFSNCLPGNPDLCCQFFLVDMCRFSALTQTVFQNNHNEPLHHASYFHRRGFPVDYHDGIPDSPNLGNSEFLCRITDPGYLRKGSLFPLSIPCIPPGPPLARQCGSPLQCQ